MKQFLYLCMLITICLKTMAQIDLYDRNWDTVFYDDFSSYRTWDPQTWISSDGKWKTLADIWITHGNNGFEHQIYQYNNCVFDLTDNTVKLVSEYDYLGTIPTWHYMIPSHMNGVYPNIYGYNNSDNGVDSWYYFSGEIDVNERPFHYGYFEIKCKLPIHPGSFPAFWLYGGEEGTSNDYYNEIDVVEYSNGIITDSINNYYRQFTCGVYCDNEHYASISIARENPILSPNVLDLRNYHVYACEWLPSSVKWYVDGNIVNEYYDRDSIPHHEMNLRTNYAINSYALSDHLNNGQPIWFDGDVMTINYIKVCQLDTHCNTDAVITCQSDLDNFDYAVMRSIAISPTSRSVTVRNTDHVTFRTTDYVEIEAPFTVEYGGEFTVIIQECPDN